MAATMRHVTIEPLSPQWHSWRAAGIGGSDAPIIAASAGMCKPAKWMKSAEALWKIKTGKKTEVFTGNWATRRGNRAEPMARAAFEKATGILLSPIYGEMADFPTVRSSFDGMDFSGDLLAECKLASAYGHQLVKGNQIPGYYEPQVIHQAMTAWGMPETWKPEHTIVFISHEIEKDDTLWVIKPALEYRAVAEKLFKKEKEFWDRVLADAEPCGPEWKAAATTFLCIRSRIDALEEEENKAKSELLTLLGDAENMSGAGVSVAKQERQGGIDYAKLISENTHLTAAEIEAYRKAGSRATVFRVQK